MFGTGANPVRNLAVRRLNLATSRENFLFLARRYREQSRQIKVAIKGGTQRISPITPHPLVHMRLVIEERTVLPLLEPQVVKLLWHVLRIYKLVVLGLVDSRVGSSL